MGKTATAYTAEDGLKVMEYLGLPLNQREQELFREHFPRFYGSSDRFDFRGTLHELYSGILPFLAYPTHTVEEQRRAVLMHFDRDEQFHAAYKSALEPQLKQGIPLRQIVGE